MENTLRAMCSDCAMCSNLSQCMIDPPAPLCQAHLVLELRDLVEIRHFVQNKLGLSDRQLGNATWPEVAHRLVQVRWVSLAGDFMRGVFGG